jgi:hypothetical protein
MTQPLLPVWALTDDEVELLAFHSHYYEGESLEEIEMEKPPYDWTISAAMSDCDDIREPITAWSVYTYEEIERREIDGKQVPLYIQKRVAGPYPTEAAANEERDTQAMINFLDQFTVLADRGEVWGL